MMCFRVVFLIGLIAASVFVSAADCYAGLSLQGPYTAGDIPDGPGQNDLIPLFDDFNLIDSGPTVAGYYGAEILFSGGADTKFRFTYFGEEAGYNNLFQLDLVDQLNPGSSSWQTVFANGVNTPGVNAAVNGSGLASIEVDAADLNLTRGVFRFGIQANSSDVTSTFVDNVDNPDDSNDSSDRNFFVSAVISRDLDGDLYLERTGFLVWLDDGGASNDDNHDDMVVFIESITDELPDPIGDQVPEPASLAIFGALGLLGFAGVRRNRRKNG